MRSSRAITILLPFLLVVPGIVAYRLFPGMADPDQAYPRLVPVNRRECAPHGLFAGGCDFCEERLCVGGIDGAHAAGHQLPWKPNGTR